jgi:hypothetical protein
MVYEVIQPVSGPSVFEEWLDKHNDTLGIHHIAYDMNGIPFVDRIKEFEKRGFTMSQDGSWMSKNHFAFFETEDVTGTCLRRMSFRMIGIIRNQKTGFLILQEKTRD